MTTKHDPQMGVEFIKDALENAGIEFEQLPTLEDGILLFTFTVDGDKYQCALSSVESVYDEDAVEEEMGEIVP